MKQNHQHTLTNLVRSRGCSIEQCSCGTYHLRIATVSIKLSREQFRELHGALGMAGAESLAGMIHAN